MMPLAGLPSAKRPWIKVCGVRTLADLEACAAAGATHAGINPWPGSPRCVPPSEVPGLVDAVRRAGLSPVLLHVQGSPLGPDDLLRARPDHLQTRIRPSDSFRSALSREGIGLIESRPAAGAPAPSWGDALLLDTPDRSREGGTGRTFAWSRALEAPRPFVLAGGLGPDNVADAIAQARPEGVDAASGLESAPGVKDPARIRAFCEAARAAFEEIPHVR